VSVLVCTYDDGSTLPGALSSALDQTLPRENYRIVVVDDGSNDATPELLEAYVTTHGVEVLRLPENRGLPAAANAGLEVIETPFFVRLDADDAFEPELLESVLFEAARTGANVVYPDRYEVTPDGAKRLVKMPAVQEAGSIVAAGKLLPTALVRSLGGYRDLFWEEIDLYLRLLESGECRTAHVARPLYRYSVGSEGRMTANASALSAGWRELREIWPEDILARHGLEAARPA
jgi:glycosyltransferase involved in cell wall biosynthesis